MTDHEHSHHQPPSERAKVIASHDSHAGHGSGHDKHAGHSVAMFRDRFWLSMLLSVPVVFFSEMIQTWFGYSAPVFPGSEWVSPVLGTVIFFVGAHRF